MNPSQLMSQTALAAAGALANSGTLSFFQGPIPSSPEAAVSAYPLATWSFASTAFGPPAFGSGLMTILANFVNSSVPGIQAGTACFARMFTQSGQAVADFTVAAPWASNLSVVLGQYVTSNGNLYVCVQAGTTGTAAPSGTGASIPDGTAVWSYVLTGFADINLNSTSVQLGTYIDLSSFVLSLPAT